MLLDAGDRLVMIGDSITDSGRARPVGESIGGGLGTGYVLYVDALIGATYPHLGVRTINMGSSGNTVRDLKARWATDMVDQRPDVATIMIGINDVWRQFDTPLQPEWAVGLDEYRATLSELVAQTKPLVKGLLLATPYYLEPNLADPMRARMDEYSEAVRGIAAEAEVILVDTQAAFDVAMRHYYPATLAWDRVHPNHVGHMVIARAFLAALGFSYGLG